MNKLTFAKRDYPYEIDGNPHVLSQMDYWVDGVPLSILLGIDNPNGLVMQARLFPDVTDWRSRELELRGRATPCNQFGSGRLVLYCCHCGCHYCGVMSCVVTRKKKTLTWSDIRGEDFCEKITAIDKLTFSVAQVDSALEHLEKDS
jgi:hypothetical protein